MSQSVMFVSLAALAGGLIAYVAVRLLAPEVSASEFSYVIGLVAIIAGGLAAILRRHARRK